MSAAQQKRNRELAQANARLRYEIVSLRQTSGDLCPTCGWRGVRGDGCDFCALASVTAERDVLAMSTAFTIARFHSVLIACGIVHESAIYDPEGYDGGATLIAVGQAYAKLVGGAMHPTIERLTADRDAARAEVAQWRSGPVTEEMLRRHDGSIRVGKGCAITVAGEVERMQAELEAMRPVVEAAVRYAESEAGTCWPPAGFSALCAAVRSYRAATAGKGVHPCL